MTADERDLCRENDLETIHHLILSKCHVALNMDLLDRTIFWRLLGATATPEQLRSFLRGAEAAGTLGVVTVEDAPAVYDPAKDPAVEHGAIDRHYDGCQYRSFRAFEDCPLRQDHRSSARSDAWAARRGEDA